MKKNRARRRELFEIATRLFMEKGYRATTMQDIAKEMGIQKPSLYHYISSKDDILKEIVDITMKRLIHSIEEIANSNTSPVQKLERIIDSHIMLICENLELFTVSLREINKINAKGFWSDVVALRDKYESHVRNILASGKRQGYFREDIDEKLVGFALLGSVNWAIRWYSPKGEKSPKEIADQWKKLFLKGLLKD
ncbi:TetR/AcrR family transcriptional regulator [Desulfothermus sp.]